MQPWLQSATKAYKYTEEWFPQVRKKSERVSYPLNFQRHKICIFKGNPNKTVLCWFSGDKHLLLLLLLTLDRGKFPYGENKAMFHINKVSNDFDRLPFFPYLFFSFYKASKSNKLQ